MPLNKETKPNLVDRTSSNNPPNYKISRKNNFDFYKIRQIFFKKFIYLLRNQS